jgi:hypothetical protein
VQLKELVIRCTVIVVRTEIEFASAGSSKVNCRLVSVHLVISSGVSI